MKQRLNKLTDLSGLLQYCVLCEHEDYISHNRETGEEYHVSYDWNNNDIEYCVGPFTTCPPPDEPSDEYWQHLFECDEMEPTFAVELASFMEVL